MAKKKHSALGVAVAAAAGAAVLASKNRKEKENVKVSCRSELPQYGTWQTGEEQQRYLLYKWKL